MATSVIDGGATPFPGATVQDIAKMTSGAIKAGGTVHSSLTVVPLPLQQEITDDSAQRFFVAGSGDFTTPTDTSEGFNLSDPTHFRKSVEINSANGMNGNLGELHRITSYKEVTTSGLEQLRDGRWVDSLGNIYAHPSGFTDVNPEIIGGLGDTSAKTKDEAAQSYFYRVGSLAVEKDLPERNG